MGYNQAGVNHLSLQYLGIPVKASSLTGTPVNPTSNPVQMAFMPGATQVPGSGDWQTAIWAAIPSDILFPYAAYCLIGPGGTVTLGIGTYIIYLKITGFPEIPVLFAGQLQIT